ncbi:Binding partner of ACD11 1-like protein [Drosera capensis]
MSAFEHTTEHWNPAVNQSAVTANWTINVPDVKTVKVANLSPFASERDLMEFFSYTGDIQYLEMGREKDTQVAYVTFKDSQQADTAILLSGSTLADLPVMITPAEDYQLPHEALLPRQVKESSGLAVQKAEDVVSMMLAKGYVLGKDVLNKAKAFDEEHHLMSTASAAVASIDYKIGITEKLSMGTSIVNKKAREVDEKFQVSGRTRHAFAAVEQTASIAGSAIMSNRFVLTGASWLSSAFGVVARAAEDVSTMTKEKVQKAEEERKEVLCRDRRDFIRDYAELHLDSLSAREGPVVSVVSSEEKLFSIM